MKIQILNQKESSWTKKIPMALRVCILTVLMYFTLLIGHYHQFQDCPCQQHAEYVLKDFGLIEKCLREYNEKRNKR